MDSISIEKKPYDSDYCKLTFEETYDNIVMKEQENIVREITIDMISKRELFELRNQIDKILLGI